MERVAQGKTNVFTKEAAEWFVAASEFAASGKVDEAESAFARTILLSPHWPIARYQLGLLQFSAGRPAVALVTWSPLFDLDGSNCLAHFVRGFAALAQDDFPQARSHFRAGLALGVQNAALAGDIEKVLARIEHIGNTTVTASLAPANEPAAASHVLVSNYGRFGNLH
jgi:tetratricopeptide (TPR) repeat protein